MIEITTANHQDLTAVAQMFDLYRQFYEQAPNPELAQTYIGERLAQKESHILIAKDSTGKGLGFCQLYPSFCSVDATRILVLYDLFVRPEARRLGLGKKLLQAAEDFAEQNNVPRLDLSTAKTNSRAQALYESMGWNRDNDYFTYSRYIKS